MNSCIFEHTASKATEEMRSICEALPNCRKRITTFMIKKYLSIAGISLFLIGLAAVVSKNEVYEPVVEDTEETEVVLSAAEAYELALNKGADLCFWYDDASYEAYFKEAAVSFYEEQGVVVEPVYVDAVDYVGSIYDATMAEEAFPDAYLLSGEELEKAYLYGVASENTQLEAYRGVVADNAVEASFYRNKCYGYPLSYNVCLLVYNNQFFDEKPASLQAIIDYSDENEPAENVEYLLEWDAYDPFFGYPFVSSCVTFSKTETEVLDVVYDETQKETLLTFLEESLASFSIPLDTVTEESVLTDVLNGVTLCAIVDSDSLQQLTAAEAYEVMEFPALNDTLSAKSAALTDMVVVNDFSTNQAVAMAFAQYVTLEQSEKLWTLSGHYSVKLSEVADHDEQVAYQAYEHAVLVPDSQDAAGFWIDLKNMITSSFEEDID